MASLFRPAAFSLALIGSLAGCDMPQGVGYTSQILAGAEDPAADFAVIPVNSQTLPIIAKWPNQPPLMQTAGWLPPGGGIKQDIVLPGDKLNLGMWSNEAMGLLTDPGQKFATMPPMVVSPEGTVNLPYAGDVHVAGLSVEEARKAIQDKLTTVMPTAQVTLNHDAGRNNAVQVVSGLPKPGLVPLPDHDFTVLDLLSEAGGVSERMINPDVQVSRNGKLYGISFDRLVQDPRLDAVLKPGDRVYVVPDKRYFMSFGQSTKQMQIRFPRAQVSALDAVSLIGGLRGNAADAKGVLVLRNYPPSAVRKNGSGPSHRRMIFAFDLLSADGLFSAGQFQIQDKDLVLVAQSPFVNTTVMTNLISQLLNLPNRSVNLILNSRKLAN